MRNVSLCLAIGVLAAAAATPTQCDKPLTAEQEAKYKRACVHYKTQVGDSPYSLAERFYGKGYMSNLIEVPNKQYLTAAGVFKPNSMIIIPPDDRGRSVDINYPYKRKY